MESPVSNSSSDTSYSYDYVYEYPYSTTWLAIVPLIVSAISIATIVGNIMVIVAYFRDHRIQANVSNIFILNLATTDLIVGAFVLPVNLDWIIKDTWVYGEVVCKLWLIVDYTVTVVSVYTMVLISWDRYCFLTMEVRYQTHQTKKRIGLIISAAWAIIVTWYTFLALAWGPMMGKYNVDYTEDCEMEFATSLVGTIVVNVFEFFIPLTALITLNMAVYANIKRRSKGSVGPSPSTNQLTLSTMSTSRNPEKNGNSSCPNNEGRDPGQVVSNQLRVVHSSNDRPSNMAVAEVNEPRPNEHLPSNSVTGHSLEAKERTFARHRKAAVVLAVLVGCFLVCWLPVQASTVMFAICGTNCVSDLNWEVTNSLVWCNSLVNPFIYAAINVHFRRNFRHFLLLDRWSCYKNRCKIERFP